MSRSERAHLVEKAGFRIKSGMTIQVNGLLTQNTRENKKRNRFEVVLRGLKMG